MEVTGQIYELNPELPLFHPLTDLVLFSPIEEGDWC